MDSIKKDVLIIGSGLAGLYTSLHLEEHLDIAVVSKDRVNLSNSVLAQGGIASCIKKDDSTNSHMEDTMNAGSYVNNVDAVEQLVLNAPKEIHKLIELGVQFDKDDNGMIMTTLEGGHSHRRVLHANGDATGKVIMETVTGQVLKRDNIHILENTMVVKIVLDKKGSLRGAIVLKDSEYTLIETNYVVIASGGIGALYKDTTNQRFSTGDGIALAKEAGCELVDMCFIQFHPTALFEDNDEQRFLITEAVRGEGGKLLNSRLESFMEKYDEREELAPRDIVSKGVFYEMKQENAKHVWLDTSHLNKGFLMKRFPTVYERLLKNGIQMDKDRIPVAPVAHYFIGGIATDLNGRTSKRGIYACGEVSSTGVHGANRLASNSLLECVVFGKRTAIDINKAIRNHRNSLLDERLRENISQYKEKKLSQDLLNELKEYDSFSLCEEAVCDFIPYKMKIKETMTSYVGIIRNDDELEKAFDIIGNLQEELNKDQRRCSLFFEINNMCTVGLEVINDAMNKSSIGCHYKEEKDYALNH